MKTEIYQSGYGWITPTGKEVVCDMFDHLMSLEGCLEVPQDVLGLMREIKECEESCQELADEEGHVNAEWHSYEMTLDENKPKIITRLYRAGFVRIGVNRHSLILEAEGTFKSLQKHHRLIGRIHKDHKAESGKDFYLVLTKRKLQDD